MQATDVKTVTLEQIVEAAERPATPLIDAIAEENKIAPAKPVEPEPLMQMMAETAWYSSLTQQCYRSLAEREEAERHCRRRRQAQEAEAYRRRMAPYYVNANNAPLWETPDPRGIVQAQPVPSRGDDSGMLRLRCRECGRVEPNLGDGCRVEGNFEVVRA